MPQLPKSERVLRKPVQLYRQLLREQGFPVPTFEQGLLAMGLEVETQARILEAFEGTSLIALNKTEISNALRSLLRRVEIDDDVLVVYDQLIELEDRERLTYVADEPDEFSVPVVALSSADEVPPHAPLGIPDSESLGRVHRLTSPPGNDEASAQASAEEE